ncbi:hypothetical protein M430DRAFT_224245 [Amorphotheca resinae ATCC 22711]|uniref:Uncharacterized protein n=1 Tax=Amorphotheca resinae ATCC 22711 TaxID=857342 RepID=A0A2T3B6E3_AMORE|nr:hypothetical protein M430DRAFT_224245 [Amorphotheca resinae ATCC 22711]PSS22339.1 hypothetical protein M430DRAFT_224245 [Amorphotheca resinae ATCC 22711]
MNVVIPSKPPFKIWQIICFLSFKIPFSSHIILFSFLLSKKPVLPRFGCYHFSRVGHRY